MRVWNIAAPKGRKVAFEPSAAEVFGVQGRREQRLFTAVAPCSEIIETGSECEYCAFGRRENLVPLCKVGRVLCRAEERKDGRQIVFIKTSVNVSEARA